MILDDAFVASHRTFSVVAVSSRRRRGGTQWPSRLFVCGDGHARAANKRPHMAFAQCMGSRITQKQINTIHVELDVFATGQYQNPSADEDVLSTQARGQPQLHSRKICRASVGHITVST